MRLCILRGPKGEVLGTFERTPGALVSVEPEVDAGCCVEEIEAPENYLEFLADFYQHCEESGRQEQGRQGGEQRE